MWLGSYVIKVNREKCILEANISAIVFWMYEIEARTHDLLDQRPQAL